MNSCATSKKSSNLKKNSIIKRAYHDITLHYNYHFNARDILKQKSKEVIKATTNDYSKILSPFPLDPNNATAMLSDMENIFKKASIGIQLHPTSKWVDDSYLLMGISNYYKGETQTAIETFQFINAEFKNGNKLHKYKAKKIKSKLKKDEETIDMPDYTKVKDQEEIKENKKPTKKPTKKKVYKKKKKSYKKKKKPASKKPSSSTKKPSTPKTTTNPVSTKPKAEEDKKKELGLSINMDPKNKKSVKFIQTDSVAIASEMAKQKKGLLGRLQHKPVAYQAQLWMLRSFIHEKKYSEAETIISSINSDPKFSKKLFGEYNAILAQYYLQKQDDEKAKFTLNKALENTKNKSTKARYNFILGQLHQKNNEFKKSKKYFAQCIKNKPDYEMQFYAQMSLLDLQQKDGTKKTNQTIAELKKMSKEAKNSDYLDKIYSTMADLSIADGKIEQAIAYLKEATKSNTSNAKIKASAYQKIAGIYFEKEQYVQAYAYYDSTKSLGVKDLPNMEETENRLAILAQLVPQLEIINREDSLQKIASLPAAAQNDIFDEIIDKALSAKEAEFDNSTIDEAPKNATASNGTWYFYNNESKSAGYNDFLKKWGSRTNSDNWRRSQKNIVIEESAEGDPTAEIENKINSGQIGRKDLLAMLPTTPEKKLISDNKIIEALYGAGGIFLLDLKNIKQAETLFERLSKDFPKNKYEEASLYQLYLLAKKSKNFTKTQLYSQKLNSVYPNGKYTQIVNNPQDNAVSADLKEVTTFYEQTFNLYLEEKYQEALNNKIVAEEMFTNNTLQPKFDFIAALCIGKISDPDSMKSALDMIIKKYPKDEVKPKAEELLLQLAKMPKNVAKVDTSKTDPKKDAKDEKSVFTHKESVKHWVMIIVNSEKNVSNEVNNRINDINTSTYSAKKLKTSKVTLSPKRTIVLIKDFENATAASKYVKEINANKALLKDLTNHDAWIIPIGNNNFNELLKLKDEELYKKFATLNFK